MLAENWAKSDAKNALRAGESKSAHAVVYSSGSFGALSEGVGCLDCMHDQQAELTEGKPPRKYIVRRLTPLECCRLQGFPDWWEDGVEGSDSARYRMWGNGMALPNMLHVMRGIARVEQEGKR
jgi:site-specific DNA-cytosine methylase